MNNARTAKPFGPAVAIALAAFALSSSPASAQLLQQARDAVRSGSEETNSNHERERRRDCSDDDDESLVGALCNVVVGSFWESRVGPVDDELSTDACGRTQWTRWYGLPAQDGEFARFPYANGYDGYMMPQEQAVFSARAWSGRLSVDYGDDFDQLGRWSGRGLFETSCGLGLDFEFNEYRERLPGGSDHLAIGDWNVLYRFVESERSQWRLGLGMNWLDDGRFDAGVNFTLQADFYPRRPWVISGQMDLGTLGDAGMFHGQITAGLLLDRVEIFGGYDYRRIEDAELEGPLVGLRLWF